MMVGVDFVRFDSKKPPTWSIGRSLRREYDQRVLIRAFISRDFRLQYHGSFLGYLWSILEPLFLTVIFYVVFVMLRDADDPLMPLKIMVGLLIFTVPILTFHVELDPVFAGPVSKVLQCVISIPFSLFLREWPLRLN